MSYTIIQNFKAGMDRRREVYASQVGALMKLINGFITEGGEVEKRRMFDVSGMGGNLITALNAGRGLVARWPNSLYVFGHTAPGVSSFSLTKGAGGTAAATMNYVQVPEPYEGAVAGGMQVTGVADSCEYQGKLFTLVTWQSFTGGGTYMYYDNQLVEKPVGMGEPLCCRVFKEKVYLLDGNRLWFSAVGNPAQFDPLVDQTAGYILLGDETSSYSTLQWHAMAPFQGRMAIANQRSIQIWNLEENPNENYMVQELSNIGVVARKSMIPIGDLDVMFLSASGIRSLRVRDSSLNATPTDLGSPIDSLVQAKMAASTATAVASAWGLYDSTTGRYMLVLDDTVYVMSYYPLAKIVAWSQFDLTHAVGVTQTAFTAYQWVQMGTQILCRGLTAAAVQDIFSYGPLVTSDEAYDNAELLVELPFLPLDTPGTYKTYFGIDLLASGKWLVESCSSYNANENIQRWRKIYEGSILTTEYQRVPMMDVAVHQAFRLKTTTALRATLSGLIVHYLKNENK